MDPLALLSYLVLAIVFGCLAFLAWLAFRKS